MIMSKDGRVTVVIATANRVRELEVTLRQLDRLPERPPTIVVDNHSSDDTADAVRRCYPGVRVVALPCNLGAAGRTVGVRLATTPYVALCDDDSWWEPGALGAAADRLDDDPRLALVAAKVLVGREGTVDPTSVQMAMDGAAHAWRQGQSGLIAVTGFLGCAALVRRSAFLAAGGFEAYLRVGGEEELLALDLAAGGWGLVYEPEARVRHCPSVRRDRAGRRRLLARNGLLTAALRYSSATLVRRAAQTGRLAATSPGARAGLADAVASVPWVLSRRRAVPAAVEAAFTEAPIGERTRSQRSGRWRVASDQDGGSRRRAGADAPSSR